MLTAPGLARLQAHCSEAYPPGTEPIIMRAAKSFIKENGPDPLDYIYIYKNEADEQRGIPQHWHYVGFGLSDIYYYNYLYRLRENNKFLASRTPALPEIFPQPTEQNPISGFGFELTFRIKCDSQEAWEQDPPQWPAQIIQNLAKYVFKCRIIFKPGDHIAGHNNSLNREEDSRIKHMLMTLDPQLNITSTDMGRVTFVQLVGVCKEEFQAAREWNVDGVLNIMKQREETGREYLVTDMRRGETIFELDPGFNDLVDSGIKNEGSDLTLISAKHKYSSSIPKWYKEVENPNHNESLVNYMKSDDYEMQDVETDQLLINQSIPGVERGNFATMAREDNITQDHSSVNSRCLSRMSYESESALLIENAEIVEIRYYSNVYLLLSSESAKILPIVLNGRLAHKRIFHYQSLRGDLMTTFIPEGFEGEFFVTKERPMARQGSWLQIYVSQQMREEMLTTIMADFDEGGSQLNLPKNYSWPDHHLYITIVEKIK